MTFHMKFRDSESFLMISRITFQVCNRAILRYSFCRGRDILDIHPSITLSILLVEHSCCTYMEAVTYIYYVFQCVINISL